MRQGWSRIGLLTCLLLALVACSSTGTAPVGDHSEKPAWKPGVHKVRPGDTLYSIAWEHGLDYQSLARWNGISRPYKILPGQRIVLKAPAPKPVRRAPAPKPAKPKPAKPSSPPVAAKPAPVRPAPVKSSPKPVLSSAAPRWRWPTDGKVIRKFQSNSPGKKGIDIAGAKGQPVRAAANGIVVYAGSGLVGYGRLIIVKHNKQYLSAYGHNKSLLISEGMEVKAGQVIAHMGNSGTNRTQLHFEIRKDGKPVDPLRYLPRKK